MWNDNKNFSNSLFSLTILISQILDNKDYEAAILMDLSKAFNTINHELLIAKLLGYGCTRESAFIFLSYHSDHWQNVQIDSSFNSWSKLTQGVTKENATFFFISNMVMEPNC